MSELRQIKAAYHETWHALKALAPNEERWGSFCGMISEELKRFTFPGTDNVNCKRCLKLMEKREVRDES